MRRTTTLMVLLALITSAVAVPAGATGQAPAQASANAETDAQANANSSVAPGEQFAGVVGVTEAEFEGEMAERTFGVRVAQNASAQARSDVVADQLKDVERRVEELEQRKERLEEARENGSMTEGEFRAEMAVVAAEKKTAARLAAHSETTARGLPQAALDHRKIDVDSIVTLRERARAIGGENVSAFARSIVGGDAGVSVGPTAEVDVDADGNVSVDVPGLSLGANADGEASADGETSGDAGSEDAEGDGTSAEVDSETEADAESDGDNTSVEVDSETSASTDL